MAKISGGVCDSLPSQKAALGTFHQNGNRVDKVAVTIFRKPHSTTGEDVVEVSCHGGKVVMDQVLNLYVKAGARSAEPGEFSQRAFLNGKMDLVQAEALADLIRAQTEHSSRVAFSQLEGGLSSRVRSLRGSLVEILSHIEVAIDHSDDIAVGTTHSAREMFREY